MKGKLFTAVVTAMAALLAGGCGTSHQARTVEVGNAILVNPEILKRGAEDQALYRYVNPRFDVRKYTAVVIEPVLIAKEGDVGAAEKENYQKLANNAYVYLGEELQKEIRVVKEPEKDTLVLQMAIHDADASKPVRSFTSTVVPIGIAINVATYAATGKPSAVGEITAEFKVTDGATGELLLAALDRRVGSVSLRGVWDTWHGADEALKFWAKRAAFLICQQKGGKGCVVP